MSEQLETYEWPVVSRKTKYPWGQWFNGNPWRVVQDEDFTAQMASFRTNLYAKARALGLLVRLRQESDSVLVFQAYKP